MSDSRVKSNYESYLQYNVNVGYKIHSVETGDRKIEKMKTLLREQTGGDMRFVECYNCEDMTIYFGPGGSFTTNTWEYCRTCMNNFWCGKCNAGWNSKETEYRSCFQPRREEEEEEEEEE